MRTVSILVLAALLGHAGCAGARSDRVTVAAEGAFGPYSSAVMSGDFCFVSGKIGERGGTFEHEVATALDAVEQALDDAGLGFPDVVAATVYLTDMDQYAAFNEIYASRLKPPYPARVCVAVAALPGGASVEVQVVARRR